MFGAYLINLISEKVIFTRICTEAMKRAIVRRSASFARALTSKTKLEENQTLFVPSEHVSSEKVGKLPSLIPIVNLSGWGAEQADMASASITVLSLHFILLLRSPRLPLLLCFWEQ